MTSKAQSRQLAFAREYVVDFNGYASAVRAGYSERSARQMASELLRAPHVMEEVKRLIIARQEKQEATVEWVVAMLVSNAKRCSQAEPVLDKLGNPTGEYRFDSAGAKGHLELLGKHLAMFTEKVEHSGSLKFEGMSDEELDGEIQRLEREVGVSRRTQ